MRFRFSRKDGPKIEAHPPGPWDVRSAAGSDAAPQDQPAVFAKPRAPLSVILIATVLLLSVGVPAYKDLSRPEAWAYWRDLYLSPSLTSSLLPDAYADASGHRHPALAVNGEIGAAAAGWFRDRLDAAHLVAGDAVYLSSPGGDLNQAMIMGTIIRSRGLVTAVGVFNRAGRAYPSYCASACVLAYAGGTTRIGLPVSRLGVHRFTIVTSGRDPVADTQRTTGMVLGYMTSMGVSPAIVEAMSATDRIRWLEPKEAVDLRLVTRLLD